MNSLHCESFRTSRKRWQPKHEEADCVPWSSWFLLHVSKQVLLGLDSQQARWRASGGLGGVARQLGVSRERQGWAADGSAKGEGSGGHTCLPGTPFMLSLWGALPGGFLNHLVPAAASCLPWLGCGDCVQIGRQGGQASGEQPQ
uniref:Uncharacterized protein n=1 Tax=Pipistrellus kuhlii TaxID=59472 RepID=A0A7J8B1T6_PIPKU|nr:hypothetical protein mPipKuh1_007661 [Pipistrellus kuhlii]